MLAREAIAIDGEEDDNAAKQVDDEHKKVIFIVHPSMTAWAK